MNPSPVSGVRKHLIQQLVFFDEQLASFLEHYFPDSFHKDRVMVEKMLQRYSALLEELLAKEDDKLLELLHAMVLIGSKVQVRFEADGEEDAFTIVYPTEIEPDRNKISCLSPIGRQLLLASPDRTIALETPVGTQNVQILHVKYAYIGGFE